MDSSVDRQISFQLHFAPNRRIRKALHLHEM